MSYETISVTPVTPRIGANIEGIALTQPLSNRQVDELHQALAEHQVLFFRNQPLDPDSHKRLGRYFGELHIHPEIDGLALWLLRDGGGPGVHAQLRHGTLG